MLNAILCDFHQGGNYSRGMWDVRNPSNKKVAATTTQPAQKQDKHEKSNHNQMLLAEKMEEIEGNMKGWDILGALPGKSHVECHSVGFPPGKKLF